MWYLILFHLKHYFSILLPLFCSPYVNISPHIDSQYSFTRMLLARNSKAKHMHFLECFCHLLGCLYDIKGPADCIMTIVTQICRCHICACSKHVVKPETTNLLINSKTSCLTMQIYCF